MFKRALPILIKHGARRADLYINHCKVMTEAVVYIARQSVAFSRGGQLFDLRGVISQQLIGLRQFRPRFALTGRYSSEDYDEHDARAVNDRYRDGVEPAVA